MDRRDFLKSSGAGLAGLALSSAMLTQVRAQAPTDRPMGANGDVRVAVIGLNDFGRSHINAYRRTPGVRIVALCDPDAEVLKARAAALDAEGIKVKTYRDLREVFDSNEIDGVSIVTPNHWHALATVWACQAGKHVTVEKPVSHCIWEGRKMVEAARKYDRLVQADLDSRAGNSGPAYAELQSGIIGKPIYVRAWNYKRRLSIGRSFGPQKIPTFIDYDLWCGPAPMVPLKRAKFHYDWHWSWPTGNGEIANNGAHNLDAVRWALGKDHAPQQVLAFGGRYGYIDDGEIPNTIAAIYDWDGIPMVYEARGLAKATDSQDMDGVIDQTATGKPIELPHTGQINGGSIIVCEGGYFRGGTFYDNDGKEIKRVERQGGEEGGGGTQAAFVRALHSGKREDLRPDIEEGHISACVSHIGNVSVQAGEAMSFDAARAAIAQNPHAEKALDRMIAHLKANGVNTSEAQLTVGPQLTFDGKSEKFTGTGSETANLFLRDSYREPFIIRDEV